MALKDAANVKICFNITSYLKQLSNIHLDNGIKFFVERTNFFWWKHSHKKRKDSLSTRAELAVLRTYVGNKAILEPILLYRTSECKQTKEQGSEHCLWTHIFTFL